MSLGEVMGVHTFLKRRLEFHEESAALVALNDLYKEIKRLRKIKLNAPISQSKLKGILGYGGRGVTGRLRRTQRMAAQQRVHAEEAVVRLAMEGATWVRWFRYMAITAVILGVTLAAVILKGG